MIPYKIAFFFVVSIAIVAGVIAWFQYKPTQLVPASMTTNTQFNEEVTDNQRYLQFSMVAQEFYYEEESVDTLNRMLDIHEQYNVPIDIILDDPSVQVYIKHDPNIMIRLRTSPVVAVSIHFRPPYPFYQRFDFLGLRTAGLEEKESRIREYFEHAIDLESGLPTDRPGGYAYIKAQIGYSPIMGGMITEKEFASTLLALYEEYGTQMVVEHRDSAISLGEQRENMPVRPEDYPIIFLERLQDSPEMVIDSDWSATNRPQFKSIKTHDNDFIATNSAWLSIYFNQGQRGTPRPPFNLSVHDTEAQLLTTEDREYRWQQYEALVSYAAEQRSEYVLVNAKDVAKLIDLPINQDTSAQETDDSVPPIYVSIVSHNEEPRSRMYPHFVQDTEAFFTHRAALVQFAEELHKRSIPYNWQSDWSFLVAAQQVDDGRETRGKNIVQYLHEDLGVEVDAHAHQSQYNYADVSYFIRSLGIEPTGVVGGFLAIPSSSSEYPELLAPIRSTVDPSYTWTPTVLWGGGSGLHQQDKTVSGVWFPKSTEDFFVAAPTGKVPVVGTYTSTWEGVHELLDLRAKGELRSDVMYTASVMIDQIDIVHTDEDDEALAQIDQLQEDIHAGAIQFVYIEDIPDIWAERFNRNSVVYSRAEQDSMTNTMPQDMRTSNQQRQSCGDGVCTPFEQKSGACMVDCR